MATVASLRPLHLVPITHMLWLNRTNEGTGDELAYFIVVIRHTYAITLPAHKLQTCTVDKLRR